MTPHRSKLTRSFFCENNNRALLSFIISVLLVFALCSFFVPHWETNDDIAMSMVAHGYGFVATGSPNLVFSNFIWGYLVHLLPKINGVLGYTLATYAVLISVGTMILYVLRQCGFGWLISFFVITLLLVRPILFPQFTINAGLLTVAAIACWHFYGRQNDQLVLLIGCLLAFFGFLVRDQEFILILLIALPLLPWRKIAKDRTTQIYLFFLIIMITVGFIVDYQAYQSSDWLAFKEFDPVRVPFSDFGAAPYLHQHPEILTKYGYSNNDIDLIAAWFFVEPKTTDSTALSAMLTELGPLTSRKTALTDGWAGIQALIHPVLLPSFVVAIILFFVLPSKKLFLTWVLALMAIFALGLLGRPGVLRVYIPVLALLLIAPLIIKNTKYHNQRHYLKRLFVSGTIIVATIFNLATTISESKEAQKHTENTQRNLHEFPSQTIVIWTEFIYEYVYPVLKQPAFIENLHIYSLGTDVLAPFSVAYHEEKRNNGLVKQLLSESGVPMIADGNHYKLLDIYCQERFNGILREIDNQQYGIHKISWRQCDVTKTE